METWNILTVTRGRWKGDNSEKKRKGLVKICVNDPWTWTTVWELTVGVGGEVGRWDKGGKLRQL